MFQEYAHVRGGYSIKWVDNTHALIIFQHPQTAKKAYVDHIHNPVAKVRPYKGQVENKSKQLNKEIAFRR
ncbi:hypothetical protein BDF20DRAFT_573927 [Mycotypha africana]|uniref:uncharacterized protein n=1 Tax=Mycotypha africana TaxID=64632 RepID=UPI0022FFCF7B|nr:uncharacterized protein BDF20DRAFT_573927 [Mycotypha africana]KAI8977547.1 hypothetical protein BDF20DRAFT_573927 [Mycotypha africana]